MSEFITLTENRDFRRAYQRGKSYVSPVLVTYVIKNNKNNLRIGITTSKKIGKAVERNRSRRVIRAALRELISKIKPGYDLVLVARGKTPYVKSTYVLKAMKEHLTQAGILESIS